MFKRTFALGVLALLALVGFSQEKKEAPPQPPAELKISPEDAAKQNPVKPTETSIADGKKIFTTQCAMCHGESGDGKGDLVEPLKLKMKMKDYRDPAALKGYTDGTLFYILTKGHREMPSQEGRMKDEQKWHLINFVRSLPPKEPPAKKEEKP